MKSGFRIITLLSSSSLSLSRSLFFLLRSHYLEKLAWWQYLSCLSLIKKWKLLQMSLLNSSLPLSLSLFHLPCSHSSFFHRYSSMLRWKTHLFLESAMRDARIVRYKWGKINCRETIRSSSQGIWQSIGINISKYFICSKSICWHYTINLKAYGVINESCIKNSPSH